MKKQQFLKELRGELKKFSDEEVSGILSYYDEMISDKMEMKQSEEAIISSLGNIKNISKEVQLDLISNRVNKTKNIEKTSNSFFILIALLLSPALFPIAIVLFVTFFTIIITSAALMISFGATAIGLIVALVPSVIFMAQTSGAAGAIFSAGTILILSALFGVLTMIFYSLTKQILNLIMKLAIKIARKNKRKV